MTLTYQQAEDAAMALSAFNPAVSFHTKLRMSRNLRVLNNLMSDLTHDRRRLTFAAVKDKTKRPDQNLTLTAEENEALQPELKKLMAEKVEADLHPIFLFDSTEGHSPSIDTSHAIDISQVPIPNDVLSRLIDIVFVGPVEVMPTCEVCDEAPPIPAEG